MSNENYKSIKVYTSTRKDLNKLSAEEGISVVKLVKKMCEEYKRKQN